MVNGKPESYYFPINPIKRLLFTLLASYQPVYLPELVNSMKSYTMSIINRPYSFCSVKYPLYCVSTGKSTLDRISFI